MRDTFRQNRALLIGRARKLQRMGLASEIETGRDASHSSMWLRFRVAASHLGGRNSSLIQPKASDRRGSQASAAVSVWPRFAHTNVRCSRPSRPSETADVIMPRLPPLQLWDAFQGWNSFRQLIPLDTRERGSCRARAQQRTGRN
jgi:hypothetical protein